MLRNHRVISTFFFFFCLNNHLMLHFFKKSFIVELKLEVGQAGAAESGLDLQFESLMMTD